MQLTRRSVLRASGSLAITTLFAPASLAAAARRSPDGRAKTLVVLFLRGGADGLNLIVPHGDPDYYRLRNWIAVRRPGEAGGALDLDGFFGLHPRASALLPFFRSGVGVALHAVGNEHNTRSHFEEQDVWETGILGNTIHSDGWLNRHLAAVEGRGPIRAVSIGDSLPRILRGEAPALALQGLADLTVRNARGGESAFHALQAAYEKSSSELLARSGEATLAAMRELRSVVDLPYEPKRAYPETDLGRRLQEVARLIKADIGLEVAEVDFGGWDTHQNQGAIGGPYSNLVGQLADAVAALCTDLEDELDDVLILTLSEFGRTAAQNGTGGTDHGWASCMLALGGPVLHAGGGKPRHVLGRWPGLAREALHENRDLQHTTDFRDVLAEVARVHLSNPDPETLLPGRSFEAVGLV